ncbi:MAG: MBL fold metallo-hydrolase [Gemmatimonadota bacterium]|nr:MBL fold metallo-hydrolase [Gemmatimonadota bacterium]
MKISRLTVGPFEENCYLVVDEGARRGVLIDPGDEASRIVRMVRDSGAELEAIWLTHAHIDHIGALAAVKREWDVPVYLHPADAALYAAGTRQASFYGLEFEQPEPPEHALTDGDRMRVGGLEFEVLHTPGHSPGLVVFHGNGIVLAGDLLFAGSIGRTDLPLSNPADMEASLARVMRQLPDELTVHPGHGPATSIGRERAANPFVTGLARVLVR